MDDQASPTLNFRLSTAATMTGLVGNLDGLRRSLHSKPSMESLIQHTTRNHCTCTALLRRVCGHDSSLFQKVYPWHT